MTTPVDVASYWRDGAVDAAALRSPATDEMLNMWEALNGCALPQFLRECLSFSNGFLDAYSDKLGFKMLSLEEIVPVSQYAGGVWKFDGASDFFVFMDYMDASWAYAFEATQNKPEKVYATGFATGGVKLIAPKTEVFFSMYIQNDSALYP
jgi:hypothetical protein